MRQRRWGVGPSSVSILGGLCGLGVMACGGEKAADEGVTRAEDDSSSEAVDAAALVSGQSCDALLADLQNNLLVQVAERAAQARASGAPYYGGGVFIDDVVPVVDSAPAAPPPGLSIAASSGFSSSTVQIPGVDEADFVKAEDDRIYLVQGQNLFVLNAVPASATELLATVAIEGDAAELFVRHGEVVVFSRVYGPLPGADAPQSPYYYYYPSYTKLTVLDATGSTPQVVRESYIEGDYSSARRQEGIVRGVVTQSTKAQLDYPTVTYQDVFGHPRSQAEIDAQVDLWVLLSTEDIQDSLIEDYLPSSYERVAGALVQQPLDCSRYLLPGAGLTQAGATSVLSFDLDAPDAPLQSTTLLAYADYVYIDQDALIFRQTNYDNYAALVPSVKTDVHLFDLDGVNATYVASGSLNGYVSGQSSLDQAGGVIRATTTEDVYQTLPEGVGEYLGTQSHVVALGNQAGSLTQLGSSLDFALDSDVFTTRFVGDRGYLLSYGGDIASVLDVVDLSDPTAISLSSSLTTSGYFSLLLPLADDQLLAIGQSLDVNSSVQLQLFDVRDAAAPAATHGYVFPAAGYSDALYDARAVTFHPRQNLISLPFQSYETNVTSLEVLRLSPTDGFSSVGSVVPGTPEMTLEECLLYLGLPSDPDSLAAIQQDPALAESYLSSCRAYNTPTARRGLFRGDYVYSVTSSSVGAYSLDALSGPPLSQVDLPVSYYSYPYPIDDVGPVPPPEFTEPQPAPPPIEGAEGDPSTLP